MNPPLSLASSPMIPIEAYVAHELLHYPTVWKRGQLGLEGFKGGGCGHVLRQDYGVREIGVLPVVSVAVGCMVRE